MRPEPPVDIALIGAGRWGWNYVGALAATAGARLVCVADPSPEVRARAAAAGLHGVSTLDEALATDPRAVVVATPPATHAPLALAAIAAGRHVLVEKPLATTSREGAAIAGAARARGVVAHVGHLTLHHPAVAWLVERAGAGAVGPVHAVNTVREGALRGSLDPAEAVMSLAPHDVALAAALLGEAPGPVVATARETGCVVELTWGEARVRFEVHRVATPARRSTTARGPRGVLHLDERSGAATLSRPEGDPASRAPIAAPLVADPAPLTRQCAAFVAAIRARTADAAPARRGLLVVAVLEAAVASLTEGGAPVQPDLTSLNAGVTPGTQAPNPVVARPPLGYPSPAP